MILIGGPPAPAGQRPALWYSSPPAQIIWVLGDVVYEVTGWYVRHNPYPSVADVFYFGRVPDAGRPACCWSGPRAAAPAATWPA